LTSGNKRNVGEERIRSKEVRRRSFWLW